jgi:hypothetical protein
LINACGAELVTIYFMTGKPEWFWRPAVRQEKNHAQDHAQNIGRSFRILGVRRGSISGVGW